MKLTWTIEPSDIQTVQDLLHSYRDHVIVRKRKERNLRDEKPAVQKEEFWKRMVACLLTTQQSSGPTSVITRFILTQPFPLAYETCLSQSGVEQFAKAKLTEFGMLRRINVLANEIAENLGRLEGGLWQQTLGTLDTLRTNQAVGPEREAAALIKKSFAGLGPKQSRNLLQSLGLTRHEIPIDSRVAKWLKKLPFPVPLSAGGLADPEYYKFVMDQIQVLCQACGVIPCILDAAIFASKDGEGWTDENAIW
jgi:hypothetical protein